MKLWNDMTVCLVLFNAICTFSVFIEHNALDHFNPLEDRMNNYPRSRLPPNTHNLLPSVWSPGRQYAPLMAPLMRSRSGSPWSNQNCALASRHLTVSDLGLGYASRQMVVFRYCVGTCRQTVTQHNRILNNLMKNGKVRNLNYLGKPCCKPSAYEDVSFYDEKLAKEDVLRSFSATACKCF